MPFVDCSSENDMSNELYFETSLIELQRECAGPPHASQTAFEAYISLLGVMLGFLHPCKLESVKTD